MENKTLFEIFCNSDSNAGPADVLISSNETSDRQIVKLNSAYESIGQDFYPWIEFSETVNKLEILGSSYTSAEIPMSWTTGAVAPPQLELTTEHRVLRNDASLRPTADEISLSYRYSADRFFEQATSSKYEAAAMFMAISAIGVADWNWGSSGFRFNNEGWFNEENTGSGGIDKLGHAYTSYLLTDILTSAIQRNSSDPRGAPITAALASLSLMTYVEIFDGFSGDHGFSYEDMVMNMLGAGFSVFRNSVPGMRDKIAFRMQYLPSPFISFEPFGDYSGQKYLLAVKLGGFEKFEDTPLRYVELHGGYYARGFAKEERRVGYEKERNFYVGIGVNLQELLFGVKSDRDHLIRKAARTSLDYIQVPYSYLSSDGNSGR
jgi:hypothetical protein